MGWIGRAQHISIQQQPTLARPSTSRSYISMPGCIFRFGERGPANLRLVYTGRPDLPYPTNTRAWPERTHWLRAKIRIEMDLTSPDVQPSCWQILGTRHRAAERSATPSCDRDARAHRYARGGGTTRPHLAGSQAPRLSCYCYVRPFWAATPTRTRTVPALSFELDRQLLHSTAS